MGEPDGSLVTIRRASELRCGCWVFRPERLRTQGVVPGAVPIVPVEGEAGHPGGARSARQGDCLGLQQRGHRVMADPEPLVGQLCGHSAGGLPRPPQRRLRTPAGPARPAPTTPGSASRSRLRPAPALRTRPSGSSPRSNCHNLRDTVDSATPAAPVIQRVPPCPRTRQPPTPVVAARPDAAATALTTSTTPPRSPSTNPHPTGQKNSECAELLIDSSLELSRSRWRRPG